MGHSVAGVHSNLSPMRYVVGHFLHVFTYILLTRVQLFIDKPRPFAQIEIDAGAHAQIFTEGTEALRGWISEDIKHQLINFKRVLEIDAPAECHWVCTSLWASPRLRLPFQPRAFRSELRSCARVEVADPVANKPTVSVDVKQHFSNSIQTEGTEHGRTYRA